MLRYRQRRADVASKRATAHALVSLSSSRPPIQIFCSSSAMTCAGDTVTGNADSNPSRASVAAVASSSESLVCSSSVPPSRTDCIVASGPDCPIDRLLRAMTCEKQCTVHGEVEVQATYTKIISSEKQPVPAETDGLLAGTKTASFSPVDAVDAATANQVSAVPKEAADAVKANRPCLAPVDTAATLVPRGGCVPSLRAEDVVGGRVEDVVGGDAHRRWCGQLSPARVMRVAAAPLGLEALACTAAEILTRNCRPAAGAPVSPPAMVGIRPGTGAIAFAVSVVARVEDEDTDGGNEGGRWERGDAQLSALSTPPFSPEVAAISSRLLAADPPLSLAV